MNKSIDPGKYGTCIESCDVNGKLGSRLAQSSAGIARLSNFSVVAEYGNSQRCRLDLTKSARNKFYKMSVIIWLKKGVEVRKRSLKMIH